MNGFTEEKKITNLNSNARAWVTQPYAQLSVQLKLALMC